MNNRDLIDTLWNVKLGKAMMYICVVFGFNRYIVECKVSLLSGLQCV